MQLSLLSDFDSPVAGAGISFLRKRFGAQDAAGAAEAFTSQKKMCIEHAGRSFFRPDEPQNARISANRFADSAYRGGARRVR
jgi:hypothetical protein